MNKRHFLSFILRLFLLLAGFSGSVLFAPGIGVYTSNDYAVLRVGYPYASPLYYGWQAIGAQSQNISLSFAATTKSDLLIAFKFGPASQDTYLEIGVGTNIGTARNAQSVMRAYSSGFVIPGSEVVLTGGTGVIASPGSSAMYNLAINDGFMVLTQTVSNLTKTIFACSMGQYAGMFFSAYSFKTYNSATLSYNNTLNITTAPALTQPNALMSNDYATQVAGAWTAAASPCFGWKQFPASMSSFKLTFTASVALGDFKIGLKTLDSSYIEINLGAYGAQPNDYSTVARVVTEGYLQDVIYVKPGLSTGTTSGSGILTKSEPMAYSLTLDNGKIVVTSIPVMGGAETTIISCTADYLKQKFTAYSFKVSNRSGYANYAVVSGYTIGQFAESVAVTSNDYATAVSDAIFPATCYGWRAFPSLTNNFSLAFSAKTTGDLHVGLQYGTDSYVEIVVGGWGNARCALRIFSNKSQINSDEYMQPVGSNQVIPDTMNYVTYVAAVGMDADTGYGVLSISATTLAGTTSTICSFKSPVLNQTFTGYSFRTYNSVGSNNTLYLTNVVATPAPPTQFSGVSVTTTDFDAATSAVFTPATVFPSKNIQPQSNSLTLSFSAVTKNDLMLALTAGDGTRLELCLGANSNMNSFYQVRRADKSLIRDTTPLTNSDGVAAVLPDVTRLANYVLRLAVDPATGSGVLTITAQVASGSPFTIVSQSSPDFNMTFASYVFKTMNSAGKYNVLNIKTDTIIANPYDYAGQAVALNNGLKAAQAVIDPVISSINDVKTKLSEAQSVFKTIASSYPGFTGTLPF